MSYDHTEYCRKWRSKNPHKVRAARKKWKLAHRKQWNAIMRDWSHRSLAIIRTYNAKRRASKHKAVVAWANDFFIREIYRLAQLRRKLTGYQWDVDHIVPLKHPLVCGLHWDGNLQIIPMKQNMAKSNVHWPDMPEGT